MKTMPYNLTIPTPTSVQTALSTSMSLTKVHDSNSLALATGKKINSSYDNSTLYFKDMRLSERAQELNSVLDGLTSVVSTLATAGESVNSIKSMLEQAKAAANSAADGQSYLAKLTGTNCKVTRNMMLEDLILSDPGDEILLRTGDADRMESDFLIEKDSTLADWGVVRGDKLNVKIGGDDWISLNVTDETMKVSDFFGQIAGRCPSGNFQSDLTDGKLTLSTTDRNPILMDGPVADLLGFDMSTTQKITIGKDWTVDRLIKEFSGIEGVSATVNSDGRLEVSSVYGDDLIIDDLKGQTAEAFGLNGFDDCGLNTTKMYADQFNEILRQINGIVADSSFNGLNLLEGDTIHAVFNEKGDNYRTVKGVRLDTISLGLSDAVGDWQDKGDIQEALQEIDNALYKLKDATNRFDRAAAMVQSRDTFLTAMSNTCLTGAENLTAADLNEAAAQILTAETQKELVNSVISITMDANSSVLSLF